LIGLALFRIGLFAISYQGFENLLLLVGALKLSGMIELVLIQLLEQLQIQELFQAV
jgi:hypothetical protein